MNCGSHYNSVFLGSAMSSPSASPAPSVEEFTAEIENSPKRTRIVSVCQNCSMTYRVSCKSVGEFCSKGMFERLLFYPIAFIDQRASHRLPHHLHNFRQSSLLPDAREKRRGDPLGDLPVPKETRRRVQSASHRGRKCSSRPHNRYNLRGEQARSHDGLAAEEDQQQPVRQHFLASLTAKYVLNARSRHIGPLTAICLFLLFVQRACHSFPRSLLPLSIICAVQSEHIICPFFVLPLPQCAD